MKSLEIPCSCGAKNCTTTLVLEDDSEKKDNVLLKIVDNKHDYSSFISIGKEEFLDLLKRVKTKYKGLV